MLWNYNVRVFGDLTKDVRVVASIIHELFRNCYVHLLILAKVLILNDEMGYGRYH